MTIGRYKMTKIERGSFTLSGTPPFSQTVLLNDSTLLADEIIFSTVAPSGGASTDLESGGGWMSPAQQTAKACFADKTLGQRSEQVNNKCILHYSRVSGAITKKVEANRNSMATPGEFTVDVTALPSNHQVYIIAYEY